MAHQINSIRLHIDFDDAMYAEEVQEFVDDLLEHHPTALSYGWEATHSSPGADALSGECAALQHFADVAAGYAEF